MILFIKRCSFFFLIITFVGCAHKKEKQVQRSFYYWKSNFQLTQPERGALQQLSIQHLYIKFFDVVWNKDKKAPEPVARISFSDPVPNGISVIPVVFITNETMRQVDSTQTDSLATNLVRLISSISSNNQLSLSGEVQIDCDWTAGTKDQYFSLLQVIKRQAFLKGKKLSATIRLHQLKFISQMGVPPVDKGLLMCYNMGDLYYPGTQNSIIDPDVLKKYINRLDVYPLTLNVALPIFDWYVLFHQNKYKGLIHTPDLKGSFSDKKIVRFEQDTNVYGLSFKKDEWLRHEMSPADELKESAKMLSNKINYSNIDVILYHLDEQNLTNYELQELESIYNRFR
ncbi:MAG TPA: hypothetical protein VNS32_06495 [Flavisolibacter sp.]|nr:hypothetical protein [Flavisolibacter sp.]